MIEGQSIVWLTIFLIWFTGLVFALFHSFTASIYFKRRVYGLGVKAHHYRLLYSVLAMVTTWIWLQFIHALADSPLYKADGPIFWLLLILQLLGLLIAIAAFIPIDAAVFLGLRRAELEPFVIKGIYKYLRHPMYSGAMLILLAMPVQTINSINFSLVVCLYLIVGSRFEEARMKNAHPEYENYQKRVPAFIPKLRSDNA